MRYLLLVVMLFLVVGCASATNGDHSEFSVPSHMSPCATVDPEMRMTITKGDGSAVGVCRADGLGDCGYSLVVGNTFVYSRPDLNFDGREDYLIKDFTGLHGVPHDVVRFMGFVSCPNDIYVQVLDDVLTDVEVKEIAPANGWGELQVTRACFEERLQEVVTREFTMEFDQGQLRYGPPNGDPALADYCTSKEKSLAPRLAD